MNENELIKRRILSILDVATLQMNEFLTLLDVKYTTTITDTACVTCDTHPILYINKAFIDEYCQTDEHLFMLIMHELYHLILGHTKLFKTITKVDNIVFDAVINSILCKSFDNPRYTSFFTSINRDDKFPSCLLRPIGENTPDKYKDTLNILYGCNTITYYELYKLVLENCDFKMDINGYCLLGSHSESNYSNPIINDLVSKLTKGWPNSMIRTGVSSGKEKETYKYELSNINPKKANNLKYILKRMGLDSLSNKSEETVKTDILSFTPNYRDRLYVAKNKIYDNKQLFLSNNYINETKLKPLENKLIYIDVSGSVLDEMKDIFPLLIYVRKKYKCQIYSFSTEVNTVGDKRLKSGEFESTYGTDINCIVDHIFDMKNAAKVKDILILTDGAVGKIKDTNLEKIIKNKIKIYVGLFGHIDKETMEKYVKEFKEI